jgi:hypothetical protein
MERSVLNLGLAPAPGEHHETTHPDADGAPMGDLMEETKSEVRRLRLRLERQEDEQETHARRTKILSVILAVLFLTLAVTSWSAYPALREGQKAAVGMLGLQTTANTLGDHVNAIEAKVNAVTGGMPALTKRMDQLQAGMKTTLQTARSQAQTVATQMTEKLRADINVSIQAIQSRLAGMESNQREASEHVAQLEDQIAGLKRELASMREETSTSAERMKKLQEDQQAQTSAVSGLDQRMTSSQSTISSLSARMERKRVGFELQGRKKEEIVPGVFLTIKRADTGKKEVDATLDFPAGTRVMSIYRQAIQSPAVFYLSDDKPIELVFTDVAKNRTSGYVLMPNE